jgi:enamine deaminase RidA (YjgF/YER057c/UK114 family)
MPLVNDADVLGRLSSLGLELPPPPQALAAYMPVVRVGDFLFVSGQVPIVEGAVVHPGRLGDSVIVEEGQEAAARAAIQSLAALRGELGTFDRLARIAQVTVYVASVPEFEQHPQVANGASELLAEVLGEDGRHARAAVGVASLPLGASVEVAVTALVA